MKTVTITISVDEFSDIIQNKISENDRMIVGDCVWAPSMIEVNPDMTVTVMAVATKKGNPVERRFRANMGVLCEQ